MADAKSPWARHTRSLAAVAREQLGHEVTLLCQMRELFQRRERAGAPPESLMRASHAEVAHQNHIGIYCQGSPHQFHTLLEVALCGAEIVPLAVKISHAEVVGWTVNQLVHLPRLRHHLHGLF